MVLAPIIAIIALLIFINGLYVAAEFSAVSSRRPRLAQMAADGSRLAQSMLNIVDNPRELDAYVAACQLGITVSSLVLGFYGQSQLTKLVAPLLVGWGQSAEFADTVSTALILFGLTVLQVVLGELVPKNVGIQYPEQLAVATTVPMVWSMRLFRPLIWVFNGSGALILRLFGRSAVAEHAHVHSPEEIRMLVEESGAGGVLQREEQRLLVNTLDLRNLTARKTMIPRNRMVTASIDLNATELLTILATSPYSRLPLYEESVDDIVGVVHLKDLLYLVHQQSIRAESTREESDVGALATGEMTAERAADSSPQDESALLNEPKLDVREIMHSVAYVPETIPAEDLLTEMQVNHQNMAIIIDEYGGTAGMVTIEDLFEEIIGEFQDEFDSERAWLQLRPGNKVIVRGDVHVEDLNEWLAINLPTNSADTIGGLIFGQLGKLPAVGDQVALMVVPSTIFEDEEESDGDSTPEDAEAAAIVARVERMYRNSIAEVSIQVSPEQVDKLHERVRVV